MLLKSPRDPEANGIMADILEHKGDNAGATRYAEIALEGNPNLIETHIVISSASFGKAGPEAGDAELRKVVSAIRMEAIIFSSTGPTGRQEMKRQRRPPWQVSTASIPRPKAVTAHEYSVDCVEALLTLQLRLSNFRRLP